MKTIIQQGKEINYLRNKIESLSLRTFSNWTKQYLNSDIGKEFSKNLAIQYPVNEHILAIQSPVNEPIVDDELTEIIQFNYKHFTQTPADVLTKKIFNRRSSYAVQFKELIIKISYIIKKKYNGISNKFNLRILFTEESIRTLFNFYIENYRITNEEIELLRYKIKSLNTRTLLKWKKKYISSDIGKEFLENLAIQYPVDEPVEEHIVQDPNELLGSSDLVSEENLLIPVTFDIGIWHTNQL